MKQLFNEESVNYKTINEELWSTYISVDKPTAQKVEELFLHLNHSMFMEIMEHVNIRKHRTLATSEDAMQMIIYNYLIELRAFRDDKGFKTYPFNIYKIVENEVKKTLSDDYMNGGMKIPYGTKKRHIKEGKYQSKYNDPTVYEQIVSGVDEYEILESIKFEKLQAYTVSTEELVTSICAPTVSSFVKDALMKALNSLSEMERDIVMLRYYHTNKKECVSWAEIGAKYDITEGGARFKCSEALIKLRTICKKEYELDACLA